jgi:hypothetical protein
MRPTLCLLAILVPACLASTAYIRHYPEPFCCGWARDVESDEATLSNFASVDLVFVLQEPEAGLESLKVAALAAANPDAHEYGQFLSRSEVERFTSVDPRKVSLVAAWLGGAVGMDAVKINRGRVSARLSEAAAEELLSTSFSSIVHVASGTRRRNAGAFSLPAQVDDAVAAVFGLHGLPALPRTRFKNGPIIQGYRNPERAKVTPKVLANVYGINLPEGIEIASNYTQAVAEFQGCNVDPTDLKGFFAKYVPGVNATASTISKFVGDANKPNTPCGEATLDIEYLMGLTPGVATEFWLWQSFDLCGDVYKWQTKVLASEAPPSVFSVSYGAQGPLNQLLQCNAQKLKLIDDSFAKMAARVISVIVSSGDDGSGYAPPDDKCGNNPEAVSLEGTVMRTVKVNGYSGNGPPNCCTLASDPPNPVSAGWSYTPPKKLSDSGGSDEGETEREREFDEDNKKEMGTCTIYSTVTGKVPSTTVQSGSTIKRVVELYSSWPAQSPWVTAVGSTRFVGNAIGATQRATDSFSSGGGFSRWANVSSWQAGAVAHFFKMAEAQQTLPPRGSFPRNGRGTPDVSVLGAGFQVLQDGKISPASGTSASAPAFAAMISLINQARIAAGKKVMGFLNPWLYKNQDAFVDVTIGSNPNTRNAAPLYGFNCTKNWDPVSGVGVPNFPKMLAAALK